jgi:hypothetical protein
MTLIPNQLTIRNPANLANIILKNSLFLNARTSSYTVNHAWRNSISELVLVATVITKVVVLFKPTTVNL